jgi:hypothetical protein
MDRRTFVKTSAALAAAVCGPSPVAAALERPGTLVLVDAALPGSRAFADAAALRAARVVEIGGDVGALWYATLAPHLAQTDAALIGALRASDFFVLERLAASARCCVSCTAPGWAPHMQAWEVTFLIARGPRAGQTR